MRPRAHRALDHLRRQWMGALALFIALATGTAYAANTIGSSDIIDGQVKTPDLATSAVTEAKLAGGAVTNAKLRNDAVNSVKVLNESLLGKDVGANALKGADIDESTLSGIGGGQAGGDLTGRYPNPLIAPDAVGSAEVLDGALNDEDVGLAFVNFELHIGVVAPGQCIERTVNADVAGDHLLLTPDFNTQSGRLVYSAEYRGNHPSMEVQACNPTAFEVDDANTNFNLLAIDAQ